MFLDYLALGLLFFVGIVIVYGIVAIHDIPYEMAKRRHHPHQDAIHVTGWVSMFTLHAIWPFLFIWATVYRPDRGWGFGDLKPGATTDAIGETLMRLEEKVSRLEIELAETRAARTAMPSAGAPGVQEAR